MDDELRRQLRDAAQAHRPDRERMLARVERGMAAPEAPRARGAFRPVTPWLRVAGATAAVAGVFAAGGYGVASAVRGDDPGPQTVATSPSPDTAQPTGSKPSTPPDPDRSEASSTHKPRPPQSPPASETPSRSGSGAGSGSDSGSGSGSRSGSAETVPAAELLWADGSIDPGSTEYWAQSNITIKAKKELTALTIELRVDQNGDVKDTGNWRSLPVEDFDVSVREAGGTLVYRWTLKDGRTVPAGEHVFAAQYNHDEGQRDAGDDSYAVAAGTEDEKTDWKGDFAPASD